MNKISSSDTPKAAAPGRDSVAPFSRSEIRDKNETAPTPAARPPAQGGQAAASQARAVAATSANPGPVRPPVRTARFETRHVVLALSFLLLVVLPTVIAASYLWSRARDQYVSVVAFSVRKEDATPSIDILGGLTQISGGSSASDTDILYDFLQSEDIVAKIDAEVDLRGKFSQAWPEDPVFAFDPSGTIEDLADHWKRQVKVLYDDRTHLITLRVSAYTPDDALEIAQATFDEASRTINRLSDIARSDATRFTRDELALAQQRLTKTRQAITAFRMRTQIVDPAADLEGQMGILNSLQASLAQALVDIDLLRENATESDQRVVQAERKIAAIRERIAEERAKFSATGEAPGGENYAQLIAEYEKLASELEFDQVAYRSAQASFDAATAEAQRQSRYLAAHIEPRRAETSLTPDRPYLLALVFGSLLLGWSILLLIYYSVRDRR